MLLFYYFVSFSISRAALHVILTRTHKCPSFLIRLFPHPSIAPPIPPPPHIPDATLRPPEQTAVSDRRGAWEVQPTRQANSSYLTSHLAADRHGGSVQVHTPHLISQQPHPVFMGVRSVSWIESEIKNNNLYIKE